MNKEQLKQKYGDEKVLCIPRWYYESACGIHNTTFALEYAIANVGYFDYRYDVEMDESVLQVIPYVVLRHNNKYFVTKRLAGDERLKGMVAFLGGHIDPSDAMMSNISKSKIAPYTTMYNGLKRELLEETTVNAKSITGDYFVDVFVDNSSQVSRCHVCQLVLVDVNTDDVKIRETEKLEGDWVTLEELNELKSNGKTEGWCGITIDLLNKVGN